MRVRSQRGCDVDTPRCERPGALSLSYADAILEAYPGWASE